MSVASRSIMEGLQIGKTLGEPFNRYFMQKDEQEAEKAAQQLRFQQAIEELGIKDPDLMANMQQIQPGATVDGQKSVMPLALTPDQTAALKGGTYTKTPDGVYQVSGPSIPEVQTREVGGHAVDFKGFKAASDQTALDNAEKDLKFKKLFADYQNGLAMKKPQEFSPGSTVGTYEDIMAGRGFKVPEKGVAPKPYTLGLGEKLVSPDGQVIAFNPKDATEKKPIVVSPGSRVIDSDGNEIFNNPSTSASGKAPSESQANAGLFGARAEQAEKDLLNATKTFDPTKVNAGNSLSSLGVVPNALKSEPRQQYEQAKENFISAVLRKESGASISATEFEKADKQYFPQTGDSPKVVAQKAANRALAAQGLNAIAKGETFSGDSMRQPSTAPSSGLAGNETANTIKQHYQAGTITKEQARKMLEAIK